MRSLHGGTSLRGASIAHRAISTVLVASCLFTGIMGCKKDPPPTLNTTPTQIVPASEVEKVVSTEMSRRTTRDANEAARKERRSLTTSEREAADSKAQELTAKEMEGYAEDMACDAPKVTVDRKVCVTNCPEDRDGFNINRQTLIVDCSDGDLYHVFAYKIDGQTVIWEGIGGPSSRKFVRREPDGTLVLLDTIRQGDFWAQDEPILTGSAAIDSWSWATALGLLPSRQTGIAANDSLKK